MTQIRFKLAALGAATLLAACGGGGSDSPSVPQGRYSSLVVFGDSLSDVGSYKVGAIAALGGGKFTVNSPTAKNWTEVLAAQYKLPEPCAAQTGFSSIIPTLPAVAIQNNTSCTNYAQGSSRITNPAGIESVAIQQAIVASALRSGASQAQANQAAITAGFGAGFIASPLTYQMANHLANAGGSYGGRELVAILAGGNDALLNLNGVQSAAAGGANAVAAAQFAGWSPGVQASVAAGGAAAAGAAQQAAIAGMTQAGTELAAAISSQVIARGAKYVVVANVPDLSQTPFAASFDPATKGFVRLLSTTFNAALKAGVAGKAEVTYVDLFAQGQDQFVNPAKYGLSNVTGRACAIASPANPLAPSALGCTNASLIAGDTSRYLFADDVHPTPYGSSLIAQAVDQGVIAAKWP